MLMYAVVTSPQYQLNWCSLSVPLKHMELKRRTVMEMRKKSPAAEAMRLLLMDYC